MSEVADENKERLSKRDKIFYSSALGACALLEAGMISIATYGFAANETDAVLIGTLGSIIALFPTLPMGAAAAMELIEDSRRTSSSS
jgi:hypothetical protein